MEHKNLKCFLKSQLQRLITKEWHKNGSQRLIMILYIPLFISTLNSGFSHVFANGCMLDLENSSILHTSGCERGDWGGFLNKNCCTVVFEKYLYALGIRANTSGKILLDSAEQSSCLSRMENTGVKGQGCGFHKFTISAIGCSNFSVNEVNQRLERNMRNLRESCDFKDVDEAWDQTCISCLKCWKDQIEVTQANEGSFTCTDSEICRFTMLISLTSTRIRDETWVRKIYSCLRNQQSFNKGKENHLSIGGFTDLADSMTQDNSNAESNKRGSGLWIFTGGVTGFITVLLYICIMLHRKKISAFQVKKISAFQVKKTASKHELLKESGYLKVTTKEVYSATNKLNESNLLGEGTAGKETSGMLDISHRKVYRGLLFDKQEVAIKHIVSDGSIETFLREVRSLTLVRHPNLVTLLGYCKKKGECFLVYELCPNGNLSEWLFEGGKILSWIQRLEIAIDSARGLYFLHTYPQGCIVHRDVKPTNILLGRNFEAKLSDFGLSKVIDLGETNASSEVRGTFGYVDLEYQTNRRVNSAGDVYSFGVVLLQILSGRKVLNMNMRKPMPLDKIARSLTRGSSTLEFADPRLHGEYSVEAFEFTFELALSCTAPKQQRPSMEQIVANLVQALEISTLEKQCTPLTVSDCSPTP